MNLLSRISRCVVGVRAGTVLGVVFFTWNLNGRLDAEQQSQELQQTQNFVSGDKLVHVDSRMNEAFKRIEQMLNGGDLKSAASTIEGIRQLGTSGDSEERIFDRLRLRWHDMAKEATLVVDGSITPKYSDVRVNGVKANEKFPIILKGYGKHMLVFSCDGYETFEKVVDIEVMNGKFSLGPVSLIRRYVIEKPLDEEPDPSSESSEPRMASDEDVRATVKKWQAALQTGDMQAYGAFYDETFIGRTFSAYSGWKKYSKSEWVNHRSIRSKWSKKIMFNVENLRIIDRSGRLVSVCFDQNYKSGGFSERGVKIISFLNMKNGDLLILKEDFIPAAVPSAPDVAGEKDKSCRQFVDKWKKACESASLADYDSLYASSFTGRTYAGKGFKSLKRSAWMNEQAKIFSKAADTVIKIEDFVVCDDQEMAGVKLVLFREIRTSGGISEITDRAFRIRMDRLGGMAIIAEICQTDKAHLNER